MSNESPINEQADRQAVRSISSYIEALLDRHQVPEKQRIRALETALGMSYAQVRRRMIGEFSFSLDELRRLAQYFREPLIPIAAAALGQPGLTARFPIAGSVLTCSIWVDGEPMPGRIGPLVALHDESTDTWTVVPAAEALERPSYEIANLVFERLPPRRVALVGDDLDAVKSIDAFLTAKGIHVQPFESAEAALAGLEHSPFDGFVVDRSAASDNLLGQIRLRHPSCPLVMLIDQINAGGATENELVMTSSASRALLLEKPARLLTLFNVLQLGFQPAPAA